MSFFIAGLFSSIDHISEPVKYLDLSITLQNSSFRNCHEISEVLNILIKENQSFFVMPIKKSDIILRMGIMICIIISLVFLMGCVSTQSGPNQSTSITQPNAPISTSKEPNLNTQIQNDPILSNHIQVTVHNVTTKSIKQKSGNEINFVIIDMSLKNEGVKESFSLDNKSLVIFEANEQGLHHIYPDPRNYEGNIKNPLPLGSLSPGEKIRGVVLFQIFDSVDSIVLYIKDPNWAILGDVFISDISDFKQVRSDKEYIKNLSLVVHSAVQKNAIQGVAADPGHKFSVINVSITNNNPTDITLQRENLVILSEKEMTLEAGGNRQPDKIARNYLRFPFTIHPGETITGPVLYGVHTGSRTNKIALSDDHFVINSMADLNNIYQYE